MNFCHFSPPLEKYFWLRWKTPPFAPPGKNPSEAHESDCIKAHNRTLLHYLHRSRDTYFFTVIFQR